MTTPRPSEHAPASGTPAELPANVANRWLGNLSIGTKLTIGFGLLVMLTLLVGALSFFASNTATDKINTTGDVRVPAALISARAQANLLRMLSDVRGYLALGDVRFRESYAQVNEAFANDLAQLDDLSEHFDAADRQRLAQLQEDYNAWSDVPERLFDLRDEQLDREPAYRLLMIEGTTLAGQILININTLIESQAQRTQNNPSESNVLLLRDMAEYQGTFASLFSGLRGYVTTNNRIFKQEYDFNTSANNIVWDRLLSNEDRLLPEQQEIMRQIQENRRAFFEQIPEQVFALLESPRRREDLFLFTDEAVPLADSMIIQLGGLTANQQTLLQLDLLDGRVELANANRQIFLGAVISVVLGILMAGVFRNNIAGPVRRLTSVAEQIRGGDLAARAQVESRDEIGTLAETFNSMTRQLSDTLLQIRKEKKRADDLLNVVIPIGVSLTAERDYNRLLESILVQAKEFCQADAGILYLRTDDNQLRYVIVRNDSQGIALGGTTGSAPSFEPLPLYHPATGEPNHTNVATYVALNGVSLNMGEHEQTNALPIDDVEHQHRTDQLAAPAIFDNGTPYETVSLLTIPLVNQEKHAQGVLQLINARNPDSDQIISFDPNLQQMMESLSSLAVAALEAYIREQVLRREIHELRIEIDEAKRQKQVSEIVDTDLFQDLQSKARNLRDRRKSQQGSKRRDE